jgi:hypothetical protein
MVDFVDVASVVLFASIILFLPTLVLTMTVNVFNNWLFPFLVISSLLLLVFLLFWPEVSGE